MKPFLIAFFAIVMMSITAMAQAPQEVTLTVSSDGPTKEDATKSALRSAIEQAFGAFVSANTTVLNDELVKNEIVTVSNGSIKDYKEISAVQTDNGSYFVTLTATVSLPNLITYAKSHGSECEFAGNTFAMNEKLKDMQYENAQKVLENLATIVKNIPDLFDYELVLEEPRPGTGIHRDLYLVNGKILIRGNNNTLNAVNLMYNTIAELCKQLDFVGGYERVDGQLYMTGNDPTVIQMPFFNRATWKLVGHNAQSFDGRELLKQIAERIQLNDNISSPTTVNIDRFHLNYFGIHKVNNSHIVYGYGNVNKPYKKERFEENCKDAKKELARGLKLDDKEDFPISYRVIPYEKTWAIQMLYFYKPIGEIDVFLEIPKKDISKYSKFWIEPKSENK